MPRVETASVSWVPRMLRSTFIHLPGVGAKKEAALWKAGISSLDGLSLKRAASNRQLQLFDAAQVDTDPIRASLTALENGDAKFFATLLPNSEHYRIALAYPQDTLFLDIETTGLSHFYDSVTMVGWSINGQYDFWLRGTNPSRLYDAIGRSKVLVTFNGSLFDLPFIRSEFPDLSLPPAHIDLRFFVRRIGLSGGQKDVEARISVRRPRQIAGLRGETAPLLWHEYIRGDEKACRRLIAYNKADIDGMRAILDFSVNAYLSKIGVPPKIRKSARVRFSRGRLRAEIRELPRPTEARAATIPNVTRLADLLPASTPSLRIVGIDLTGSERRPTGWALLDGDEVSTQRLASDCELIDATLDAKPTLVSIDSPLSLPKGRVTVFDDDPGREEYGITRECERVLKRRGVNVYPSLIRSMQALTSRGMRLAAELRRRGIPVIESFPGAAQDIMGIPRKRKDLRLLAEGLHEFGVRGTFTHENVSHDELDAITSAVVGAFFWSGRFEALGNPDEEYLIIPSREPRPTWNRLLVIGLSGPIGAGKTTTGKLLEEEGFFYTRFSKVLSDLLESRGEGVTRESLQRFGYDVHQTRGQRWLAAQLVASIPRNDFVVIDGLRWAEDHSYFVETFGPHFRHFYVEADEDTRLARHVRSGGTPENFAIAIQHPVEFEVRTMERFAHAKLVNNGRLDELLGSVQSILKKFRYSSQPLTLRDECCGDV